MKQLILDLTKEYQKITIEEDTELIGLFAGHDFAKIKSVLDLVHSSPNHKSLTLIKAVLFDDAVFDFAGKLIINKGAAQTDAYLRVDVLLMSSRASARAVPSLEITEDNVKGGHGATIGQVDKEQLFYLQSRGLSAEAAEKLLVQGFVTDLLEKIDDKATREKLEKLISL